MRVLWVEGPGMQPTELHHSTHDAIHAPFNSAMALSYFRSALTSCRRPTVWQLNPLDQTMSTCVCAYVWCLFNGGARLLSPEICVIQLSLQSVCATETIKRTHKNTLLGLLRLYYPQQATSCVCSARLCSVCTMYVWCTCSGGRDETCVQHVLLSHIT